MTPKHAQQFFQLASNYGEYEYDCSLRVVKNAGDKSYDVKVLDDSGEVVGHERIEFVTLDGKTFAKVGSAILVNLVPSAFFAVMYA